MYKFNYADFQSEINIAADYYMYKFNYADFQSEINIAAVLNVQVQLC